MKHRTSTATAFVAFASILTAWAPTGASEAAIPIEGQVQLLAAEHGVRLDDFACDEQACIARGTAASQARLMAFVATTAPWQPELAANAEAEVTEFRFEASLKMRASAVEVPLPPALRQAARDRHILLDAQTCTAGSCTVSGSAPSIEALADLVSYLPFTLSLTKVEANPLARRFELRLRDLAPDIT